MDLGSMLLHFEVLHYPGPMRATDGRLPVSTGLFAKVPRQAHLLAEGARFRDESHRAPPQKREGGRHPCVELQDGALEIGVVPEVEGLCWPVGGTQ